MDGDYCVENVFQILLMAVYPIFLYFALPEGHWTVKGRFSRTEQIKNEIDAIRSELHQTESAILESHVSTIEPLKGEYLTGRIGHAIDYAIGRHDWYEEQRTKILTTILTLGTFSIAVVALFLGAGASKQAAFMGSGYVWVVATTILCAVYHFNDELDQDRSYRLVSDIRTWFFRYNLPERSSNNMSDPIAAASAVREERKRFLERIAENLDLQRALREDFEQIFVLQVLQRYKNESLTKLRHLLLYMCAFESVLFLLAFIHVLRAA